MEMESSQSGEMMAESREFRDFLLLLKNTIQEQLIREQMGSEIVDTHDKNSWIEKNWILPGYSKAFEKFFHSYASNEERRKVLNNEFTTLLEQRMNPTDASEKLVKELLPYFKEFFVINNLSLDPSSEDGIVHAKGERSRDQLPPWGDKDDEPHTLH